MKGEHPAIAIGFGLNGSTAEAGRGREVLLRPDSVDHLLESLKKQWKRYRRELRLCQKHFSAEAVHRSRVATRRLLSAVELLAALLPPGEVEKARRALKRHLDVFGDLRDTQVQLVAVGSLPRRFAAAPVFRAYLRKREARFSKRTRKAIKRVKTKRLGELIAALRTEATARAQEHPPAVLATRLLRQVNKAFSRTVKLRSRITPQDPRTIHSTRVAFKQFRYMVEALAHDLRGISPALLEAMHDYQTMMGNIQDNEVLLQVFDKFAAREKVTPELAEPSRGELELRRQRLIEKFLGSADQLLQFWVPAGVRRSAGRPGPQQPRRNAAR